jgi:hypothetical protein
VACEIATPVFETVIVFFTDTKFIGLKVLKSTILSLSSLKILALKR